MQKLEIPCFYIIIVCSVCIKVQNDFIFVVLFTHLNLEYGWHLALLTDLKWKATMMRAISVTWYNR